MTTQLPPEDQAPGQGLIPASESEVRDIIASSPPDGPWEAGRQFFIALTDSRGPQRDVLREMVTPESLADWGDFSNARQLLEGTGMTSLADTPAPGAAYVKFVSDPGRPLRADSYVPIMARAIATLQFRPESGRWLVHKLGEYCLPEDLPSLPAAG